MNQPIYLDYNATTPVDPKVSEVMQPFWTKEFGNPSSSNHQYGWISSANVDMARKTIADAIGAKPKEIYFTSGATESNNMTLMGIAYHYLCPKKDLKQRPHFITTNIEHKAVKDVCGYLENWDVQITYLPVNELGQVTAQQVEDAIQPNTKLISIMLANNEIGSINPIQQIGQVAKKHNVLFHTDAAQAIGKVSIDVNNMNLDYLSLSGHKIYAPKGIGALYVRDGKARESLTPLQYGGSQEKGLRPGTLNVPCIMGLARAIELMANPEEKTHIQTLRDKLIVEIQKLFPDAKLNGHPTERLYNNISLSIPDICPSELSCALDGVAYSSSSACSSNQAAPSYVLKAIGLSDELCASTLRLGLGRFNTEDEISQVIGKFKALAELKGQKDITT